ncbi:hypothetical protein AGR8A_Cc40510 [Agrobacterium fabrum str. J-07]|nr:hypothetical protein AGR8A_Cc40510 [Agrobacterium fabrum str. J-07]
MTIFDIRSELGVTNLVWWDRIISYKHSHWFLAEHHQF